MLPEISLTIRNLEFRFDKADSFRLWIDQLDHSFCGILGLHGLSGSGKTSFSKLLCGLLKPSAGTIALSMNSGATLPRVGYAPQFPERILLGVQIGDTVRQIASLKRREPDLITLIQKYLQCFSLDFERIKNRSGYELSGGELRRLALALSLSLAPDLLILDEPTVGLGRRGKAQLFSILENFQNDHQIIIVSHDFKLIRQICRHYWILHEGNLIFNGDDETLRSFPDIIEQVGINSLEKYFSQ
ncbi:MAG TPA: energy-coupling factor ABC transporter ATP-binding protein [Candidatus Marinimicrobia bacterium]|nr:energy-coupling factor ABC transporter ATP-binding protein [Candidatus Neomarinimicrobiota bacterium]